MSDVNVRYPRTAPPIYNDVKRKPRYLMAGELIRVHENILRCLWLCLDVEITMQSETL